MRSTPSFRPGSNNREGLNWGWPPRRIRLLQLSVHITRSCFGIAPADDDDEVSSGQTQRVGGGGVFILRNRTSKPLKKQRRSDQGRAARKLKKRDLVRRARCQWNSAPEVNIPQHSMPDSRSTIGIFDRENSATTIS